MNGHFNLCPDCDFLKLYTEISSLTRIFHEKRAATGSRVSFLENRGSIKTIKEGGSAEQIFPNPYFAHNSAPTGAEVCEIKTTPPESIILWRVQMAE